jgi:hypothetical protein
MKKKIVTLMAALVLVVNMLFANTGGNLIPESVLSAFNQRFSNAKEIHWDGLDNYYKVTFSQNGHMLYVFYSDQAEYMGIAKNILSDKLPDLLITGIKNKYQGYWISDLAQYSVVDKTGFLVTLENADEKIVLKTNDNLHWQVYSKESKL